LAVAEAAACVRNRSIRLGFGVPWISLESAFVWCYPEVAAGIVPMKVASSANRSSRAAAKCAARRADRVRLESGLSPAALQRENSVFPAGFFKKARISNLSEVVGR
jgi:hypothetical protein